MAKMSKWPKQHQIHMLVSTVALFPTPTFTFPLNRVIYHPHCFTTIVVNLPHLPLFDLFVHYFLYMQDCSLHI
jgi:hypothetical protein